MDNRDILKRIGKLALSYTPEWKVDYSNPDAGAVIALIFAKQMNDSIKIYERMNESFHEQYIRMLDIMPKGARSSKVLLKLEVSKGNKGIMLPKSSSFVADMKDDERGIFVSCEPVYVAGTGIDRIIAQKSAAGQKKLCLGKNYIPEILSDNKRCVCVDTFEGIDFNSPLIDEEEKDEAVFFHEHAFHDLNTPITIKFYSNMLLGEEIGSGSFSLWYVADDGIRSVKVVAAREDYAVVYFDGQLREFRDDDDDFAAHAIVLRREKKDDRDCAIDRIEITGRADNVEPDFVSVNNIEYTCDKVEAFGDTIGMYGELVVGCEQCFVHAGAVLSIAFSLEYEETVVGVGPKQEPDLRIIKRKPHTEAKPVYPTVRIQKVVYEYYSKSGWRTLDIMEENAKELFNGRNEGKIVLHACCPDDFACADISGYNNLAIRIRIVKADNCYMLPSIHIIPVISGMKLSYNNISAPAVIDRYELVSDSKKTSGRIQKGGIIFKGEKNAEDVLYIGFDEKIEFGPVNFFFKIRVMAQDETSDCHFQYSSGDGFKALNVIDNTMGFNVPGIVSFIPPADFEKISVMGRSQYFIRIVLKKAGKRIRNIPMIEDILFNVVEAENIHSIEPLEFVLEKSQADMDFKLGINNLYDAMVWVNEIDDVTPEEVSECLKYSPDTCRAEYDLDGNIKSFFRLWVETDNFLNESNPRCYILDRCNSSIRFSDGIRNRIPRVTGDTAFIVQPRVSEGSKANVPAGSITQGLGTASRISRIENPYPAYGGTDIEDSGNIVESRSYKLETGCRLITVKDYEKAAQNFSDDIDKARCFCDDSRRINIVLMMSDFAAGPASFFRMRAELVRYMQKNCELTIPIDELRVIQPVYVSVSVTLWVHVYERANSYFVLKEIDKALKEFLEPVSGAGYHGWDIGELPDKNQIIVRLKFIEDKALIKELSLNCAYTDERGYHEEDIENIKIMPYMVVCGGEHKYRMV
nr:MAG TPA: putative baseplate assembly protein [Caudoviricetes sp.]